MSKETLHIVDSLIEAWNSHDAAQVLPFYHPECEGADTYQPRKIIHGQEGMARMLSTYWCSFPDLKFNRDDTIIEGEQVALFWTARGTHRGPLLNIPPTGRAIEVRGVTRLLLNDGQVHFADSLWDVAGLLRAIGLLPDL